MIVALIVLVWVAAGGVVARIAARLEDEDGLFGYPPMRAYVVVFWPVVLVLAPAVKLLAWIGGEKKT